MIPTPPFCATPPKGYLLIPEYFKLSRSNLASGLYIWSVTFRLNRSLRQNMSYILSQNLFLAPQWRPVVRNQLHYIHATGLCWGVAKFQQPTSKIRATLSLWTMSVMHERRWLWRSPLYITRGHQWPWRSKYVKGCSNFVPVEEKYQFLAWL